MLSVQLPESQFFELLDTLPGAAVWMQCIRNNHGEPINFRVRFVGQEAGKLPNTLGAFSPGTMLLHGETPSATQQAHFRQLVNILQTGQPYQITQGQLTEEYRPMADGVLCLIKPTPVDANPGSWSQTMIEGTTQGVMLLEPVFAEDRITDFRILAANPALSVMTHVTPAEAIGRLHSEVFPQYRADGFFRQFCATYTDGQPRRVESYYSDEKLQGWFEVAAVRHGNGLVLTFSNSTEARQYKKALEETNTYLQRIIDSSQTGILVLKPVCNEAGEVIDFQFTRSNRLTEAVVGQQPETLRQALVERWANIIREPALMERYRHTYHTGENARFETNYNLDGFDIWFNVQCTRQDDEVLVTFTDITALKKTQQTLEWQLSRNREQAGLLNSILDSSDNGIMAFEAIRSPEDGNKIVDFRFLMANQASTNVTGRAPSSVIGRTLLRVFPGNADSGLFDGYVHTTQTGEPYHTEVYYNYDGLDFWLTISAHKLGDGFVVTFSDVSALKRATRIVEQSAMELQTIINSSQTGIILYEPVKNEQGELVDFRIRRANRQIAGYMKLEPEDMVGALASEWFPDYKNQGLFAQYCHTYRTAETLHFDFNYEDGEMCLWFDIISTKMGDDVLVTLVDYTTLKRLQQQLEGSVADLQRSNDNLQQFAYVASHDLQEPLRKIQAFGDVLKLNYAPLLGEGSDIITRMQASAMRMSTLIRDLLEYSRLSTQTMPMGPVALNNVVSLVLEDLDVPISETHASIQFADLPTVRGEESQLRQLFQNLISNALKFRKPEAQPIISIRAQTVMAAELPADVSPVRKASRYHMITVSDNGIGFDERYRERIFQVFQRLHSKLQYPGTGIGLAIVQKVVDNHGGAITAFSTMDEGATFVVYLPC